jgi:hypothetical protein
MDKRRYVSRSPNVTKSPKGIAADETGNIAKDGYTVRHREPLDQASRQSKRRACLYSESYAAGTLRDTDGGWYGDY